MERVKGIGPSRLAWKARALPLSYTRILLNNIFVFNISQKLSHSRTKRFTPNRRFGFSAYTTELHPHTFKNCFVSENCCPPHWLKSVDIALFTALSRWGQVLVYCKKRRMSTLFSQKCLKIYDFLQSSVFLWHKRNNLTAGTSIFNGQNAKGFFFAKMRKGYTAWIHH